MEKSEFTQDIYTTSLANGAIRANELGTVLRGDRFSLSPKDTFYCAYTGISMNPTLSRLDLLEIKNDHKERIQIGDIVLFRSKGGPLIVHRIVGLTTKGFRTRGDNNPYADKGFLAPEDIIGHVVGAYYGQRHRMIAGGTTGRLYACYIHGFNAMYRIVATLIAPIYRSLVKYSDFCGLSRLYPPKIIRYSYAGQMVLMLGPKMVGGYNPLSGQWQICPPFRLFIDEAILAKNIDTMNCEERYE